MKCLWACPTCDKTVRSDPLASDDWGGEEVLIGPDCEDCGDEMQLVEERTEPTLTK